MADEFRSSFPDDLDGERVVTPDILTASGISSFNNDGYSVTDGDNVDNDEGSKYGIGFFVFVCGCVGCLELSNDSSDLLDKDEDGDGDNDDDRVGDWEDGDDDDGKNPPVVSKGSCTTDCGTVSPWRYVEVLDNWPPYV